MTAKMRHWLVMISQELWRGNVEQVLVRRQRNANAVHVLGKRVCRNRERIPDALRAGDLRRRTLRIRQTAELLWRGLFPFIYFLRPNQGHSSLVSECSAFPTWTDRNERTVGRFEPKSYHCVSAMIGNAKTVLVERRFRGERRSREPLLRRR